MSSLSLVKKIMTKISILLFTFIPENRTWKVGNQSKEKDIFKEDKMSSMPSHSDDTIVLSHDQLLALMLQYIAYLSVHNQTQDPGSIVRDIFNDQLSHDRVMYSMFSHMARYGMPQNFPSDGSIFNTTSHLVCNQVKFLPL